MKQIQSSTKFYILISFTLMMISSHLLLAENKKADALSSATCPAIKESIPSGLSIRISGKVRNEYNLNSEYLSKLSTIRIRTREVSPEGIVMGAYIYHGIPVYFILDGIVPLKTENDSFDRPLDLMVSFTSASGKTSRFSYGELTMCDDNNPVTLAFHRSQLFPSKSSEKYKKNIYTKPLKGFRLICPGDLYDDRYLDNVISIRFSLLRTTNTLFPELNKKKNCNSEHLYYIRNGKRYKSSFTKIPIITISNWFRIGHGRGIKSTNFDSVKGYSLTAWLEKYLGPGKPGDYYIFAGCDGYRSIFSWTEIFQTSNGKKMIIITEMNRQRKKKGLTLGPLGDFFVDRCIWGLDCVEKISI